MKQVHEVRERLIEAARELFAQDGFDRASVRDITARAQANLGAITYHFGSKEALYHAVIERFATPLADPDSIAFCDGHNMSMVFTGIRHFKH